MSVTYLRSPSGPPNSPAFISLAGKVEVPQKDKIGFRVFGFRGELHMVAESNC